jgi:hypothetical protein
MFEAQKIKALSLVNPSFRALESRPLRINQQSLSIGSSAIHKGFGLHTGYSGYQENMDSHTFHTDLIANQGRGGLCLTCPGSCRAGRRALGHPWHTGCSRIYCYTGSRIGRRDCSVRSDYT